MSAPIPGGLRPERVLARQLPPAGRVAGKVALITGAARGQGRAHALRLASEGADVILVDICRQIDTVPYPMATSGDLSETACSVEALGRRVVTAEVDVRDYGALQAAVDAGVNKLGRLDIVSAGAGIVSVGSAHELSTAAWRDVIDVNLTGVWHTTKAAIPAMIATGQGGSIIITSSSGGLMAVPNLVHYIAAKHGLVGLAKTLALELAPFFIRVNSIHPTTVNTHMVMNDANFRLFRPDLTDPGVEDAREAFLGLNALPVPWIEPEDVTNAVLLLASDESRYVTGVALPVDAGSIIK